MYAGMSAPFYQGAGSVGMHDMAIVDDFDDDRIDERFDGDDDSCDDGNEYVI